MEIIETTGRRITIELTDHEHKQLTFFCHTVFLDLESLIHIFFRSLYNFVIQYLVTRNLDGS